MFNRLIWQKGKNKQTCFVNQAVPQSSISKTSSYIKKHLKYMGSFKKR